MASPWYSLVSQKLFLARCLLDQSTTRVDGEEADRTTDTERTLKSEAARQGAVELMLRARQLLLTMIARHHQFRNEQPASLEELATLVGEHSYEAIKLLELSRTSGSWWQHLDQLERAQSNPPVSRKTVSSDNIIAISAETGPDRSEGALKKSLGALKQFADDLEEQHSEW
ncbi:hypothetical protein QVZ43_00835 [Marinobacter sp. chi1]|uniref:Uncharacterized protein n=1 Tax=Marinobacter suaedae TaxID=3057675 RepID=A0ABT8VW84_9GAMM|nr:DUF6586 family protein [Marinobacter sp. chi1]MDO3720246.1 hypothetical protein [Marinobacter sp. chi1]